MNKLWNSLLEHEDLNYECGTEVRIGDKIMVQHGPEGKALARVIAIGTDLVDGNIDDSFYAWAKTDGIIDQNTVVVEWIESNPLAHQDPNYAPVGNYMFLQSLCCERFIERRDKP